jgi:hypothetical protein
MPAVSGMAFTAEAGRVRPGADLTMLAGMAFPVQVVFVEVSEGGP